MRNILNRNEFKKLNENSEGIRDVSNTKPNVPAIKSAWSDSVVGSLSNMVVDSIKKIYKWGRAKYFKNKLLNDLNVEYIKAIVFYADKNNIDLTTGEFMIENKEEETNIEVNDDAGISGDLKEKSEIPNFYKFDEIFKEIHDINDISGNKIEIVKGWVDYLKKSIDKKKKGVFMKPDGNVFNDEDTINFETKQEKILKNNIEKALKGEDKIKQQKVYDKWLSERKRWIADFKRIIDIYRNFKSKEINLLELDLTTDDDKERAIKKIYDENSLGVKNSEYNIEDIDIKELSEEDKAQLRIITKFLYNNYKDVTTSEKKQKLLNVIKSYVELKNKVKEKKEANPENVYEKLAVKKGDLSGKSLNLKISDIFSNKEQEELFKVDKNISIQDMAVGKMSKLIEDTEELSKKGVANEVNKYKLEVIRLTSKDFFDSGNLKKSWEKSVNRVYSYWEDILDIQEVDILKNLSFHDVKPKIIDSEKNGIDTNFSTSHLYNELKGEKITASRMGNDKLLFIFEYLNNSYIFTAVGSSIKLNKSVGINIANCLISETDKEGKITYKDGHELLENTFIKKDNILFINNKSTYDFKSISTHFILNNLKVPNSLDSNPRSCIINVINVVTDNSGNEKICFYNKNGNNITIDELETEPKLNIKVKYVCKINTVDSDLWNLTKIENMKGRDILATKEKEIKEFLKNSQNKKNKK